MRFRTLKKQKNTTQEAKKLQKPSLFLVYRIKALIIDIFMIYMPIMYVMTYLVLDGKDDLQASTLAPFIGTLLYGLIYAVFISKSGQTPGKKAYEIQIIDKKTKKNIGLFRSFFRFLAFLMTATTVFGLFLPLFRKDNRMLHEILLGTITTQIVDLKK